MYFVMTLAPREYPHATIFAFGYLLFNSSVTSWKSRVNPALYGLHVLSFNPAFPLAIIQAERHPLFVASAHID